jgi:hypothetical protein
MVDLKLSNIDNRGHMKDLPSFLSEPYDARQYILVGSRGFRFDRAVKRARKNAVLITRLDKNEIGRAMDFFPPGHPRNGTVYVAHPLLGIQYFPLADFQRYLFERRAREAINLLESLGATEIIVEQIGGTSSVREAGANVLMPGLADAGLKTTRESASGIGLEYYGAYSPVGEPTVPKDLLWYQSELQWQDIVRARLQRGMTSFDLRVVHSENYGVSARVSAAVSQVGLSIGGEFRDFTSLAWRMRGTFESYQPEPVTQLAKAGTQLTLDDVLDSTWAFGDDPGRVVRFLDGNLAIFEEESENEESGDVVVEGQWHLEADRITFDRQGYNLYAAAVNGDEMTGFLRQMQGESSFELPTKLHRVVAN